MKLFNTPLTEQSHDRPVDIVGITGASLVTIRIQSGAIPPNDLAVTELEPGFLGGIKRPALFFR